MAGSMLKRYGATQGVGQNARNVAIIMTGSDYQHAVTFDFVKITKFRRLPVALALVSGFQCLQEVST